MASFFDPSVSAELRRRMEGLAPDSQARWGRMNVAQMLAHCSVGMGMPLGEVPVKAGLVSLLGRLLKQRVLGDRPWRQGVPTDKALLVQDSRGFTQERERFLERFDRLAQGPSAIQARVHPFFGEMNDEEWGVLMTKHLDHHLRQFGV